MNGDDPTGEIERAGRRTLADEPYDLGCELALIDIGERIYTTGWQEEMRRRRAALERLVGDYLDQLLADED